MIRSEGGEKEKIFIAGGFADISQTNCTVLAEEAVPLNALKAETLQNELNRLDEDMKYVETAEEKTRLTEPQYDR